VFIYIPCFVVATWGKCELCRRGFLDTFVLDDLVRENTHQHINVGIHRTSSLAAVAKIGRS
jgi:hypothetical protein